MKRLNYLLLIVMIIALLLTGCWNRREIETLDFMMGAGVDYDIKTKLYKITVQIAKTSSLTKGANEKGNAYVIYHGEGRTIFDATRNVTHTASSKLFWSHNLVYIIGAEAAKRGVTPILDFVERDAELRRTFWVLISKGPAEEIIRLDPKTTKVPIMGLDNLIETASKATSTVKATTINDLMAQLANSDLSSTVSLISTTQKSQNEDYYLAGSAALQGDKLHTFLTSNETRSLLWVNGDVKSSIVVIISPLSKKRIALEVFGSNSEIKTSLDNGKPKVEINISFEANIGEQFDDMNYVNPRLYKQLENTADKVIESEVKKTIKKYQGLGLDIFGFNNDFHRQHKKEWKQMKKNWKKVYPKLEVSVKVKSSLRRTSMITKS